MSLYLAMVDYEIAKAGLYGVRYHCSNCVRGFVSFFKRGTVAPAFASCSWCKSTDTYKIAWK